MKVAAALTQVIKEGGKKTNCHREGYTYRGIEGACRTHSFNGGRRIRILVTKAIDRQKRLDPDIRGRDQTEDSVRDMSRKKR